MRIGLALLALLPMLIAPACAQDQQLIPLPYPSGAEGAHGLSAPLTRHHQRLIPTPYPRQIGPNALGNPRPSRVRGHQRLLKRPYPRLDR